MRIGKWRGMPRTLALATALGLGLALANSARAVDYPFHTDSREVPAYDFTTGGPYMAPPIPYGHYAKDPLGGVHKFLSCPACQLHGLLGGGGGGHSMFHTVMETVGGGGRAVTANSATATNGGTGDHRISSGLVASWICGRSPRGYGCRG